MKKIITIVSIISISFIVFCNSKSEQKNMDNDNESYVDSSKSNETEIEDVNLENQNKNLENPIKYLSWKITDSGYRYNNAKNNPTLCTGRDKSYKIEFINKHSSSEIIINKYIVKFEGFYSQSGGSSACNSGSMEKESLGSISVGNTFSKKVDLLRSEDWKIKSIKEVIIKDVKWK